MISIMCSWSNSPDILLLITLAIRWCGLASTASSPLVLEPIDADSWFCATPGPHHLPLHPHPHLHLQEAVEPRAPSLPRRVLWHPCSPLWPRYQYGLPVRQRRQVVNVSVLLFDWDANGVFLFGQRHHGDNCVVSILLPLDKNVLLMVGIAVWTKHCTIA